MLKKLATILSGTALLATAFLAAPATAQAETHGPCGFYNNSHHQAEYNNCTVNAVTFTVDKVWSGDYDACVSAKDVRLLGEEYRGAAGGVRGVKNVHYLDGSYCDWIGG